MPFQTNVPTLEKLLIQFENIGGPEMYGPEGIVILLALWRKSSKLGWKDSFQMTNTELQVQTGIKSRETINTHRTKLMKDGLMEYTPPPRGQARGEYKLNFHFIDTGEVVQNMDHLADNFLKAVGEPVQNMDHFHQIEGKPVQKLDHLTDTVLKILIDRLIDGLDDEQLKLRCGVLTTAVGSFSTGQIRLDTSSVTQRAVEVERYFNQRKGRLQGSPLDWEHAMMVAREPIPMEFILFGIDLSFARHARVRRRDTDTINAFSYCQKVIFSTWDQVIKAIESGVQTTPVPPGTVSRGSTRSRNQEQMDELEKFIEEERLREQVGDC
ncbi:hypothetical protein GC096_30495 [Paenibacillus sp. LMG 31461]|uniref:Uncharacterized protein n=1 Tax=Paenibacillus plantarum TaxID=2654975 RepID=A0ABX1XKG6_9BACL|nr:hypothetical protein [Paenibacillus plantarum]NOU68360.1 hypothetical protein [Paenibacillus plantarum]